METHTHKRTKARHKSGSNKSELHVEAGVAALAQVCRDMVVRDLTGTSDVPTVAPVLSKLAEAIGELLTETQLSVADLHHRTALNEAVLRSIGEGLYVIDTQYRITLMNPRARELLGLEGTHIIGRSLDEVVRVEDENGSVIPKERRPIVEAFHAREVLTYSTPHRVLYFVNRKTGMRFPVTITVAPVICKGENIAAVSVFRDSSAEVELRRAKDEFISLASHQLRTPLSIIALNLEILNRYYHDSVSEEVADHLTEIAHASRRMQRLINSILNASRIEMGSIVPSFSTVDMVTLADTVLSENTKQMNEKALTVVYNKPNRPVLVHADPQLVEVALDNVLSNAVKYSFSNTAITLEVQELSTGTVVSVSNHGRGIPAYQRQRIFSKLFRADNAEEATEDGTGLGLYIARSLIEKMGGSIWFDSRPDRTTTFSLRFRRADGDTHTSHPS